jgi:hypothetical protein
MSRGRRAGWLALLLAVLLAAAWWGWRAEEVPVPRPAGWSPALLDWPAGGPPAPAGASAALAAGRVAAPVRAVAPPPGHIEVCGRGWVAPPEFPASGASLAVIVGRPRADWEREWELQAHELRMATTAALAASGDEFARALALALREDPAGAAALAQRSADPRVYALAWQLCGGRQELAACQQLSLRRWAQLDPGNAWPWLELLEEAQRRQDASGIEEALHHALRARRVDGGQGLLSGGVAERLPAQAPPGGRFMLQVELIGRELAAPIDGIGAALRTCSAAALKDANRRQSCGTLARLLMSEGRSLLDVSVGIGIGERVGLDARQMPVTSAQLKQAQQALLELMPPEESTSCRGLQALDGWVRERARDGEWPALRAWQLRAAASASAAAPAP